MPMIFKNNFIFFFNRFVRKHSITFLAILLLSIISYSFTFINPLFFQISIDNIFINKESQLLNFVILGMLFIFSISAITSYLNGYLMGKLNNTLYKEVSLSLFSIILDSSMKNYQSKDTGDLITRVMSNVQLAVSISSSIIPHIFTSIITIMLPFIIMLHLIFS
jgi:ABC-type bacteriocin/lantibiotic exporter with double-glycine peptidase domain